MIRTQISAPRAGQLRRRRLAGDDCGPYPAASGFAAQPYRPLDADEQAKYLAAVSVYQQCLSKAQGTPPCPLGSWFSGGTVDGSGVWSGQCISNYTGQPTSPMGAYPAGAAPPVATAAPVAIPAAPGGLLSTGVFEVRKQMPIPPRAPASILTSATSWPWYAWAALAGGGLLLLGAKH